ncbi:MAG: hypothetical protein ACLT08_03365 [Roseburia inulinivorans]
MFVSAIANDGVLMNPYVIDHAEKLTTVYVVDAYEPDRIRYAYVNG